MLEILLKKKRDLDDASDRLNLLHKKSESRVKKHTPYQIFCDKNDIHPIHE
jgi:hypothetical protein